MANPSSSETPKPQPEVQSRTLIRKGLDAFFGKLGDAIHGATQEEEPQVTPSSKDIEAQGESKDDDAAPEDDAPKVA